MQASQAECHSMVNTIQHNDFEAESRRRLVMSLLKVFDLLRKFSLMLTRRFRSYKASTRRPAESAESRRLTGPSGAYKTHSQYFSSYESV